MDIVRFNPDKDLTSLEYYLRNSYLEERRARSWLPARLHDVIYRVGAQEMDEGRERSADYMFLWKKEGDITACILPDGENIYISVKTGCEDLFPSVVKFGEKNCLPLFTQTGKGSVKFWVAVNDSFRYMHQILSESGYGRYTDVETASCMLPMKTDPVVKVPEGFRLMYGEEYTDEANKWGALRLGFHPEWESADYRAPMGPYNARKKSSFYNDCFECIISDANAKEKNDICAYCFVYVDTVTGTALIEPVSTRERYRHKGLGTAMLNAAVMRCRKIGIGKCYVNSFGWRKDFYGAAGFIPEETVSFWYKTLNCS